MYKAFLHTHYLVVTLFLLIYVVKTTLLLSNRQAVLQKFTRMVKIPEMIISVLFLLTGVYLLTQLPVVKPMMWIKIALVLLSIPLAIVGFKKSNKALAVLSLLMILGAFGLAEMNHKKQGQVDVAPGTSIAANDGKALYEANCVLCHGADGKLGMAGALDLSKTVLDLPSITQVISQGRGAMPAAQVSNEQAAAIADYVAAHIKGK